MHTNFFDKLLTHLRFFNHPHKDLLKKAKSFGLEELAVATLRQEEESLQMLEWAKNKTKVCHRIKKIRDSIEQNFHETEAILEVQKAVIETVSRLYHEGKISSDTGAKIIGCKPKEFNSFLSKTTCMTIESNEPK